MQKSSRVIGEGVGLNSSPWGMMALNCAVAEWMTRTAKDPDTIPDDYLIRTL